MCHWRSLFQFICLAAQLSGCITSFKVEPKELIEKVCGNEIVPDKVYPKPLVEDLKPWYVYIEDSGHCLLAVLEQFSHSDREISTHMMAVPVLSVLRGYEIRDGYIIVDLPYHATRGLLVPSEDEEY